MAPRNGKPDKAKGGKPDKNKLDKKLRAAEQRIEALTLTVETLQAEVVQLEAESARWQRKARKHRSRVEKVRAAAEIAIAEATAVARKRTTRTAASAQLIADHPRAEPLALLGAPGLPEPSWTVARLREAAREQGVAGYGRMRKDQLLAVLI